MTIFKKHVQFGHFSSVNTQLTFSWCLSELQGHFEKTCVPDCFSCLNKLIKTSYTLCGETGFQVKQEIKPL